MGGLLGRLPRGDRDEDLPWGRRHGALTLVLAGSGPQVLLVGLLAGASVGLIAGAAAVPLLAAAVARVVDLTSIIEVLRGKVEFESGEEGRETEILEHLLRKATADTVRAHLGGIDMAPLVTALESGEPVVTGDRVTASELLKSCLLYTSPSPRDS